MATERQMAYMRELLSRPTAFNKDTWAETEPYWPQWSVEGMSYQISELTALIERDWLYRQHLAYKRMSADERAELFEALDETWS